MNISPLIEQALSTNPCDALLRHPLTRGGFHVLPSCAGDVTLSVSILIDGVPWVMGASGKTVEDAASAMLVKIDGLQGKGGTG